MSGALARRSAIATIWIFLALLIAPAQAQACQCIPSMSIEEAITSSTLIVRGRVIEVIQDAEDEYLRTVRIEVFAYWKDESSELLPIIEIRDHALACTSGIGEELMVGTDWVVLAEEWAGELETSECLYTMQWKHAEFYGVTSALGDPLAVPTDLMTFSTVKGRYE